jgi:hypothetical protein
LKLAALSKHVRDFTVGPATPAHFINEFTVRFEPRTWVWWQAVENGLKLIVHAVAPKGF